MESGTSPQVPDVSAIKRLLKARHERIAPAFYRAALCLGAICVLGAVAPVWRISRYAAEMGDPSAPSFVGTLVRSLIVFGPGLLALTWGAQRFIAGRLSAAIDESRVVPAEIVRGPVPIGDMTRGASGLEGALGVGETLLRVLGFPTVVVDFKLVLDGSETVQRSNFLFPDEQLIRDAEGRALALVAPGAPRRLGWVCRTAPPSR